MTACSEMTARFLLVMITVARPVGILTAVFTEEDARAGEPVSGKVRLRVEVARLTQEQDE